MKSILGTKLDMSQIYGPDGAVRGVTAIKAATSYVTQVRTVERDGYSAIQLAAGTKKHASKALRGHTKEIGSFQKDAGFRYVKEMRLDSTGDIAVGDRVDLSSFQPGEKVAVTGWSKGKGFAGVVKRHHFHGHPTSHGHKDQERMPGSIGSGGVQRVFKGLRMAGRMGDEQVTVKGLTVMSIDTENSIMYVKGAVPGARNGFLIIRAEGDALYKKESDIQTPQAQEEAVSQNEELTPPVDVVEAPSQREEAEHIAHQEVVPHEHEGGLETDEIAVLAAQKDGSPQQELAQETGFPASQDEPTNIDEATGGVSSDNGPTA